MKTILYHNQNCSKSCAVLEKMTELTPDFEIVNYLEKPPSKAQLIEILTLLNVPASSLVRKNEGIYQQRYAHKELVEEEWIEVLLKYPLLLERPIVIHGNQAAIGRPIDLIVKLFQ